MLRGGSWINNPENCRSAYRNNNDPDNRNDNIGIRVVVSGASALHLSELMDGNRRAHIEESRAVPVMLAIASKNQNRSSSLVSFAEQLLDPF
ncbi:SUMF1/EgtB/PvdO family nonheme iron enzyme [Scytonema sp. NUACC26]|uniref:SUMF1/EgtB/PvdO family nonheme iron enzyme n=1 Tax=Scytonema sp. NUACC26 TaxID=3140176 RepID=UPI0038B3D505